VLLCISTIDEFCSPRLRIEDASLNVVVWGADLKFININANVKFDSSPVSTARMFTFISYVFDTVCLNFALRRVLRFLCPLYFL
jgi:hypothetical protein